MAYQIVFTRPFTYLDKLSEAVAGYEIVFDLKSNNERHKIYVPRMDAALIDSEIRAFIAERAKLDSLAK